MEPCRHVYCPAVASVTERNTFFFYLLNDKSGSADVGLVEVSISFPDSRETKQVWMFLFPVAVWASAAGPKPRFWNSSCISREQSLRGEIAFYGHESVTHLEGSDCLEESKNMTYERGLLAEADRLFRTVTSLRRQGGVSFVRCVAGPSAGYHRVQNYTFNLTTFFFFSFYNGKALVLETGSVK